MFRKMLDEESNEFLTTEKRVTIKESLSNMSFEDLKALKNSMGTKLYNETVFGIKRFSRNIRKSTDGPMEISSKHKMASNKYLNLVSGKRHIPRDPRFDSLCGTYDSETFKDSYKFVVDLRINEKKELEKQLRETDDLEQKEKLAFLVQRLGNQIREEEKSQQEKQRIKFERKEMKEKLKSGVKPDFKKKSIKRLQNLIGKYEDLKESDKIRKHIEKRTKKLQSKDKKQMWQNKLL